ncbi:MAG TPA: DUF748 domain-containing protein [Sulfurimonas sp.]|uniref:DUF748 domain-containing protein n=1 Tax=Sulfurimonas sp. TaxID=2022749 RepID=UPI002D081316|nr:DUF748 domain-containing protein [Sulfurimonas sp.]HUH42057.1 DUF748 domain-containing protein [Sulfurimonas sp.]
MFKRIFLFLIALYTGVGFLILPLLLESQIPKIVANNTNSNITIKDISFNPYLFKINLSDVELKDNEDKHLASFSSLYIDLKFLSLLRGAIHIKEMNLKNPQISLLYDKDKIFNFSKLAKQSNKDESSTTDKSADIPRVIVDNFTLSNGIVRYEDFTKPKKFEFMVDTINFKLTDIDTNDFTSSNAKFRFNSNLQDGGEVDFRVNVIGFKPFIVDGSVDIKDAKLYSAWKYVQDSLGIEIADGVLSFGATYNFNIDDINATQVNNIYLSLNDLRVKPKDTNNDILTLKSLNISGANIEPMAQRVSVKDVVVDSLNAKVERNTKGETDWSGYFKSSGPSNEEVQKEDNATQWSVVVESVDLKKIAASFKDSSIKPSVVSKLNSLNAEIKNITLLGDEPITYALDLVLNESAKCTLDGSLIHKNLSLYSYVKCTDFDITHYNPYIDTIAKEELKRFNIFLSSATLGLDANLSLNDKGEGIEARLSGANVDIKNMALNRRDNKEKIAEFKKFSINRAKLDTKTKEIDIENVSLDALALEIKKAKDGTLNLESLIETKEVKSPKSTKTVEEPYRVKLGSFDINSAKLSYDDKSIKEPSKTTIDKINISAKNIDSKEKSWFDYSADLRVNAKGYMNSKGSIKHTPLEQKGEFKLKNISLKELTPYLSESTFLKISDGSLNLRAKSSYKQKADKYKATVDGALSIENFFLHDTRDGSTVASFIKAELNSFKFDTLSNELNMDEVLLDSFYVDAQIDKNKTMNLAKLLKEKEEPIEQEETQNKTPLHFKLLNLKVTNGSANFADYSLPLDFKTSIHSLNGNVYAISSNKGEVSYVEIDGGVDEYGSTKLKGSVESSNFKSYTDLNFNFRNLNLNNFSGYSAQFAGYKIEEGKFFLDLEYKIYDSQLLGKNSLIIKKIKLGDEVEDENITKLPLRFAVALLEDTQGVIDINMPVEGDVSKPDFKYGAMILKTFVNLIVKAVASPFKFLASTMGINSDDMEFVEFEASESAMLASEREKLDSVVKILQEKPKLSLGISGGFDAKVDKEAIQAKKLTQLILKQSSNSSGVTIRTVEFLCSRFLGNETVRALKSETEKKNQNELFKLEYEKALFEKCTQMQSVNDEELRELADIRAQSIANYLIQTKNIEPSRVLVEDAKARSDSKERWVKSSLKIEIK